MSLRLELVKEKKIVSYPSSSSEYYDWPNLEVRKISSIYNSPESVKKLRSQLSLSSEQIILEPCDVGEPICFNPPPPRPGASSPEYFYMYETMFTRLNMKLPFSDFECGVLRTLNIAPSQLHPNGWAYVHAFGILCRNIGFDPSAGLFLFFFKRILSRKGWISLYGRMFSLFTSSYRDFKTKYFRVKSSDDFPELIKDASLGYKFPLYWSPNPSSIAGTRTERSSLSPTERARARFLEKFLTLSSSKIINLENEPDALRQYLADMRPMTKEKAIQGEVCPPENQEPTKQSGYCTILEYVTNKRKRTSENVAEVSTPNMLMRPSTQKSPSDTCEIEPWQSILQESNKVIGETSSLWDRQFPMPELIDADLTGSKDEEKVKKLNSRQICRALETYAVQSAFLSRSLEKEMEQRGKNFEDIGTLKRSNEELKGQLDKAKSDLDDLRNKFHTLEVDNIEKELKIKELEEEKKNLVTSMETSRDEFKVACERLMRSFGRG